MTIHPAHRMPFSELHEGLQSEINNGRVFEQVGAKGLRLYCYTEETVYERLWNPINMLARGLILDVDKGEVVACPFPKFFNVGEGAHTVPDLPFEVFDKLDGSLIIIYWHDDRWQCATKGSFMSDQAQWAQNILDSYLDKSNFIEGYTYLCEAIYPSNRIVVDYKGRERLELLAIYRSDGSEINYDGVAYLAQLLGWGMVQRYEFTNISELMEKAKTLDCNSEGWVLRFSDGTRLKIKGDEYCRIHRLVSNLSPLNVWKVMRGREQPEEYLAAETLEQMRRDLPEEFWGDFDLIVELLEERLNDLIEKVKLECGLINDMPDKEVGLRLHEFSEDIRRFIFPYRQGKLLDGRTRHALFEAIRPNRNVLPGYRASSSVMRVQENE